MALDLVTGYKGQNHVTAEQWADFNRGIYGDAAILPIGSKMQVEIQTANQITVKDGTGVFDGRQVYIGYGESENIAIESGTQQMLRHDIVVIKYTKDETSGVENVAFEVITGTPVASDPTDPSYQDMDIRTGVFTSQKPFCRVRLNGVAIEGVDMLVEVKEFADHAFEPLAENLTTSEPGRALDATMGKQLKESMDELEDDVSELTQNMSLLEASWTPNTNFSGSAHKIGKKRMIYVETGWLPWTSEKQVAGWTSDIPAVIDSKYAIMMSGSGAPIGICNVDIGDDTVISITPPTDWVSGTSAHIRAWISYYIE